MILVLWLIPLLAVVSAIFLYRHNGKREILRFDLVQFVYAFLIAPALFIWVKSFAFYLLRREFDLALSLSQLFILDTALSTFLLFVYGFVVIHSLTTSFKLKRISDPLYDIFLHSEYFHLWLSHLVIYGGVMVVVTLATLLNIMFPFTFTPNKPALVLSMVVGVIIGCFGYIGIWLGDPLQANFLRIMKLMIAFFLLIHLMVFFVLDPHFSVAYAAYWCDLMIFVASACMALFIDRSERATSFLDRFKYSTGWGKNVELFKRKG